MTYDEIIAKVADDMGLSSEFVDKVYKLFWFTIKEKIKELPLKDELTEEEFNRLTTNYNIPSLGKLSCTYDKYQSVKRKFNYIKNIRKRNEDTEEDQASMEHSHHNDGCL